MATGEAVDGIPGVRTPLGVTLAVWRALFLREAVARLSSGRAAWVWLILEPIAHVAFLMVVFSLIRDRHVAGADFALFLALGVMGFNLFKSASQRAIGAIDANRALFTYRQIRAVDVVLMRMALEAFLQLVVLLILLFGAAQFGMDVVPHDPLMFGAALLFLLLFGVGLGLMLSVGATLVPEIAKVAKLLFQPLYFLSGVFFSPALVPPVMRDWLLLNPIMHGIECLRGAMFPGYHMIVEVSLGYLAFWGLVTAFLGLALHVRHARGLVSR